MIPSRNLENLGVQYYEERPTQTKGRGQFARGYINKGTQIMYENPLFSTERSTPMAIYLQYWTASPGGRDAFLNVKSVEN